MRSSVLGPGRPGRQDRPKITSSASPAIHDARIVGPAQGRRGPHGTPITAEGHFATSGIHRVINRLIDGGVGGIFVLGTTGETASVPAAGLRR